MPVPRPWSHVLPAPPDPVEAPEEPELEVYASRLGEDEYRLRLHREALMRARRGKGAARGVCRLERQLRLYEIVRWSLKIAGLWGRAERNYLDVRMVRREWRLSNLPAAFDGFRLLQLSDLHADLHPAFPETVGRVLDGVECDAAVVTGDFRYCTYSDHGAAQAASEAILSRLRAPIYATLGNHDTLRKVPGLERAGVRFLLNENVALERGGERLWLAGIDDPNYYGSHNLERALAGIPAEACALLLSHSPETHAEAAAAGVDLLLAGHTHGGQLCLPGGHVVVHDGSSPRRMLRGAWRSGSLQGYTHPGTGATGLPVRLNCPAEVTLHVLRSGRARGA